MTDTFAPQCRRRAFVEPALGTQLPHLCSQRLRASYHHSLSATLGRDIRVYIVNPACEQARLSCFPRYASRPLAASGAVPHTCSCGALQPLLRTLQRIGRVVNRVRVA